jgi:hypothetical protein
VQPIVHLQQVLRRRGVGAQFFVELPIGSRGNQAHLHVLLMHIKSRTVLSAAFVKCCNKTERPLEAFYVVLCGVYASSGFNERSISAAFVKCCNKTERPLEAFYVVLCGVYASSGFNERSIREYLHLFTPLLCSALLCSNLSTTVPSLWWECSNRGVGA